MYTLSDIVTYLVVRILSETLVGYIEKHGEDRTRKEFETVFSWMVENDASFIEWVRENKPHWLRYLSRVRRIRRLIHWDTEDFTSKIVEALRSNGIKVGEKEVRWIRKTLEEVRRLIYC